MLFDLSVHSTSSPQIRSGHVSAFSCVMQPLSKATIGVVLSFSLFFLQQIRSMFPPRPSTQEAHPLLQKACPEYSCSCLSTRRTVRIHICSENTRFQRFFIFIHHFPFQPLPRGTSIGSKSSPLGARSVFSLDSRAHSSAILVSRLLRLVHNVGFCGFRFFVQVEIEDVVLAVDCDELFSSAPTHQSFQVLANFAVQWNLGTSVGSQIDILSSFARGLSSTTQHFVLHSEPSVRNLETAKLHRQEAIHH